MVGGTGLEPVHLTAIDFKSISSTNFDSLPCFILIHTLLNMY